MKTSTNDSFVPLPPLDAPSLQGRKWPPAPHPRPTGRHGQGHARFLMFSSRRTQRLSRGSRTL
ncbi:hypothetical protein OH77DRAFT_505419 [Trametes cingulata]|nr:hypothetical protein OH77DRAFT_505419 [Trametes cingulata]